ncbi:MAG TPA: hypothetical protein HPP80_06395 [Rhodospirillaceae bacterium]|nr:hypothetical protein [Rhodospirillaceae bacterium]
MPISTDQDAGLAEATAASILVMQKAVVDWCLRGPCDSGSTDIPVAELVLPASYGISSGLHARADGHRVWTYVEAPAVNMHLIAVCLENLTAGRSATGLSFVYNGQVTLLTRRLLPVPLPNSVPANVVLVIETVKA